MQPMRMGKDPAALIPTPYYATIECSHPSHRSSAELPGALPLQQLCKLAARRLRTIRMSTDTKNNCDMIKQALVGVASVAVFDCLWSRQPLIGPI